MIRRKAHAPLLREDGAIATNHEEDPMSETAAGRVGHMDRVFRVAIGLILIGFALACPFAAELGASTQWISGLVGAVLVATAALRFCPLYRVLGICTARGSGPVG